MYPCAFAGVFLDPKTAPVSVMLIAKKCSVRHQTMSDHTILFYSRSSSHPSKEVRLHYDINCMCMTSHPRINSPPLILEFPTKQIFAPFLLFVFLIKTLGNNPEAPIFGLIFNHFPFRTPSKSGNFVLAPRWAVAAPWRCSLPSL